MFSVDADDPTPIYAQLNRAVRAAIASGRLPPNAKLPTIRHLAAELHVNANTVAKVYAELEHAGVLETQRGVGTFVREQGNASTTKRDRERELRPIVERMLADAAARGISLPEVMQYLKTLTKA